MTQFDNPYANPYVDPVGQQPKTSGLAVTALVFSILGIIPCLGLVTGPVGVLLGLIGVVTIGSNPMRKGKGLAIAAIIVGLILSGAQFYGSKKIYDFFYGFYAQVMKGPDDALKAGFAGDIAGFKSHFHGAGATASDAEAKAFIDQLRSRYGQYQSVKFNEQKGQANRPPTGQASMPFPYVLTFSNGNQDADVEVIFADQTTGKFVKQLGHIVVIDAQAGNLAYPPDAKIGGTSGTSRPAGRTGGAATQRSPTGNGTGDGG